ncbi:MAG: hypothetical protein KBB37_05850 [Bacteroidia bacterium]|nr:hypothetical protein [Bacteroidia bacterium]
MQELLFMLGLMALFALTVLFMLKKKRGYLVYTSGKAKKFRLQFEQFPTKHFKQQTVQLKSGEESAEFTADLSVNTMGIFITSTSKYYPSGLLLFFKADAMETIQPAAFALLEQLHIKDSSSVVIKAHYEKELMNRAFTLTIPIASEELVRLLKIYTDTKL